MKRALRGSAGAGFLLYETMISLSIFSAISLALSMGFVSLERNFVATTDFATNHTDAMRISDYLALDLRRALSIQTAQNNTTIKIPAYYDASGAPQTPHLENGSVVYGSAGSVVQIRYYLLNGTIYRQLDSNTPTAIAENVKDFIFNVTDLGKVATTRITFNPIFATTGPTQDAIDATAVYNTTLLRNTRSDTGSGVY
ncbi:MAG: PulJ/GspJ family protein [Rhodanobacteraceae bacterium]